MTIHLHPTAPLAERVLLPGDPGRALLLAQDLLERPAMFNHHRGLWGYTGTASDGAALTIQSTGMGGPSAAIVIAELVNLGARQLLRVGTCGAFDPALELGDLVIVTEAIPGDGTSRALGATGLVRPSPDVLAALTDVRDERSAGDEQSVRGERIHTGTVVSTDLFYDGPARELEDWIAAGVIAVEMETAALFALAARRGVSSGSLLLVSDLLRPSRRRIAPDALLVAEHRLGSLAAAALTRTAGRDGPPVAG